MAFLPLLLTWATVLCHGVRADDDSGAFVQKVVQEHIVDEAVFTAGKATVATQQGPVAYTTLGPVRGVHMQGYDVFRGIPYVEKPARFAKSVPKKPWGPVMLNATDFGRGCIGAHVGVTEDEDCLNLNVWLPPGGKQNMPVIVYFHGGINQHGSGHEDLRHGDLIVQSKKYPVVFVNFDFRLGIFGWIYGKPGSNITNNLGFMDQQEVLRWVKNNIAAFGGDPTRVTLQGQSEGCGIVEYHMVAPGSMNLFHRVAMHSPPADMWSRKTNEERTKFLIQRLGCQRPDTASILECLNKFTAQWVWNGDWVAEELSRNPLITFNWWSHWFGMLAFSAGKSVSETVGSLGWHAVVDGTTIPGEPRELIRQGKWNKVSVLMTISPNETLGIFPAGRLSEVVYPWVYDRLLKKDDLPRVMKAYGESLEKSGITVNHFDDFDLDNQIITDKMFTCDARSMAHDMMASGGKAYIGMFWHKPKYDIVSRSTNTICESGTATCHAAEMLYVLPQGRNKGVHGIGMEKELEFVDRYMNEFLKFVYGEKPAWEPYDLQTEPITFYDSHGPRVVPGYRKEQCEVLDSSMGAQLPNFAHHKPSFVHKK